MRATLKIITMTIWHFSILSQTTILNKIKLQNNKYIGLIITTTTTIIVKEKKSTTSCSEGKNALKCLL